MVFYKIRGEVVTIHSCLKLMTRRSNLIVTGKPQPVVGIYRFTSWSTPTPNLTKLKDWKTNWAYMRIEDEQKSQLYFVVLNLVVLSSYSE